VVLIIRKFKKKNCGPIYKKISYLLRYSYFLKDIFITTRNLAFCQGTMPGAEAPGKFSRSNARETPGKLQFQTGQNARSKPLASCCNPWQIVGGKIWFKLKWGNLCFLQKILQNFEKLKCQGLNPWQNAQTCGKLLTCFW